jgi:hypothetical protein
MTSLRFQNGEDFFEMAVSIEEDAALPSHGDACLTSTVRSAGFAGHNNLWVHESIMSKFCRALVRMEHSLSGEATLESLSPNELELSVRPVTSRGPSRHRRKHRLRYSQREWRALAFARFWTGVRTFATFCCDQACMGAKVCAVSCSRSFRRSLSWGPRSIMNRSTPHGGRCCRASLHAGIERNA